MNPKLHKIMLSKILLDIYKDQELGTNLLFKGGTCAMFFYDLPRMSVDLDFDLLEKKNGQVILQQLEKILSKYGEITDKKDKFYTIFVEFRYKEGESRIKIEISKRGKSGEGVIRNFLGESVFIMNEKDLFSNKLCALLGRKGVANRDIFDAWYFLSKGIDINEKIIKQKTGKSLKKYLLEVKEFISNYDFNKSLYGLGDLIDIETKKFMKNKLKNQFLGYLEFYLG